MPLMTHYLPVPYTRSTPYGSFVHLVGTIFMTFVVAASALAQVTAKQGIDGTSQPDQEQRFVSPMILELPFPAADPSTWDKGHIRGQKIGRFICEGISFRDFAVSVNRARKGNVTIEYHMVLANEPGVDKVAMVRLALVQGDKELARSVVPWFQVEEGRISIRRATMPLSAEALTNGSPPQLRITLSAKDDD